MQWESQAISGSPYICLFDERPDPTIFCVYKFIWRMKINMMVEAFVRTMILDDFLLWIIWRCNGRLQLCFLMFVSCLSSELVFKVVLCCGLYGLQGFYFLLLWINFGGATNRNCFGGAFMAPIWVLLLEITIGDCILHFKAMVEKLWDRWLHCGLWCLWHSLLILCPCGLWVAFLKENSRLVIV